MKLSKQDKAIIEEYRQKFFESGGGAFHVDGENSEFTSYELLEQFLLTTLAKERARVTVEREKILEYLKKYRYSTIAEGWATRFKEPITIRDLEEIL